MPPAPDTIESLRSENERLQRLVEKLTRELSRELADHVEVRNQLQEKSRSLSDILSAEYGLIGRDAGMESRYRLMAENIHEMVSIMDMNGTYIYANLKTVKFHGKSIGEVLGKSFYEVMGPEVADRFAIDLFLPCIRTGNSVTGQATFNRANGIVYLDSAAHPLFNDSGRLIGMLNITRDVTESKQLQHQHDLEQQINFASSMPGETTEILKSIFLTLCRLEYVESGVIYLLDEKAVSLELLVHFNLSPENLEIVERYIQNPALRDVLSLLSPRYDILESQTEPVQKMARDRDVRAVALLPLAIGEKPMGYLVIASAQDNPFSEGRRITIESIAYRIAGLIGMQRAQEELKETIGVLNSTIADIRIKQQMLIQKSKMESLGEMSAGMAHEVNQPLMIISLSVENILQKLSSQKERIAPSYLKKKIETIQQNITRITRIIDNLRVFARDQSGILFEKVNVGEVVERTLEMIGPQLKKNGIYVGQEMPDVPLFILGNRFKLEQAFINLFSNSIYAVNVKAAGNPPRGYHKKLGIKVTAAGSKVSIELTDNGIGITEENKEKLFTPFFTTKPEGSGTGLGLPIVYGIVREMNGEIKVTSEPDEFTCFRLAFPLV